MFWGGADPFYEFQSSTIVLNLVRAEMLYQIMCPEYSFLLSALNMSNIIAFKCHIHCYHSSGRVKLV